MELEWGHLVETLGVLRGWGRKELAVAVGLDLTTIDKYVQGKQKPLAESRKRVEEALAISKDVACYLGELREELIGARRGSGGGVDEIIDRASRESSRLMQAALWSALEEMREDLKREPGLPWGALIETVRTLLGWGQEELARRAGVNTSTVSRQETAKSQGVKEVREKILDALGLQGIEDRVRLELGGIRAMMTAPRREAVRPGIEKAGEETGQTRAAAMRACLMEELDHPERL